MNKIPVTVLTGFLGSGKTTLLNRILSTQHGKRIAVIENEFGQIGIDQSLVIRAEEEIFEMSNGCICCTVRGDLIRILGNLAKRRDQFDYVLIETTGLADPGPVAQTFFMDDEVRDHFTLDGIVTVVDSKHIAQQLGRSRESAEQLAFADVLLLNKVDLVASDSLDDLEGRVRAMNTMARVYRTRDANIEVDKLLNLGAFDLDATLGRRPTFLEPEYPFEWTGVYQLAAGRHLLGLEEGPDPDMSLVAISVEANDDSTLRERAEWVVRRFAEPPMRAEPRTGLAIDGQHRRLNLTGPGPKRFDLEVDQPGLVALYSQHLPEEFAMRLTTAEGVVLTPQASKTWQPAHEHDDEVGSVAIEVEGCLDVEKFDAWMGDLLRERGADIFRMKGFLSMGDDPQRHIMQGVHMLLDGIRGAPWGSAPRLNQLVLIGRKLDGHAITSGFRACLQ
jgi:G3E family GTPase